MGCTLYYCRSSLFLIDNGDVYGCGANKMGQCGIKQTKGSQIERAQKIICLKDINRIYVGSNHNICLSFHDDRVWVFGSNKSNELGIEEGAKAILPILHPLFKDYRMKHCG